MAENKLAVEDALRWPELALDDPRHDGPLVTIAIPTRDGLTHLERLFDGLRRRTRYRRFEVVVVDNASADGTDGWLEEEHGFDVRTITNDHNATFSAANNQALAAARGELFLLLNNDVDPMSPDWLTRLVAPLVRDPDVAGTGALLVYPSRAPDPGRTRIHSDLTVQHAGMRFEIDRGRVRGRNIAAGADPREPAFRRTRAVPGLTAACLLTRTTLLRELGGLDERYVYGSEDWDLSLRLASRGRLLLVGRSVLYHHEYGTQDDDEAQAVADRRRDNHRVFNATWGASVRRRLLLEALGEVPHGPPLAGDRAPSVAASDRVNRTATRLVSDLVSLGWTRHEGPGSPLLLVADEDVGPADAAVTLAMLDAAPRGERIPGASVVLGSGAHEPPVVGTPVAAVSGGPDVVGATLAVLRGHVRRPRIAIGNCAPDSDLGAKWGDTHFAGSLADAFADFGISADVQRADRWGDPRAQSHDILVHLRGLHPREPLPGATNVLWIISHPEDVTDQELDAYDLVLVASSLFAEELRGRTSTPLEVLHQATDLRRFRPKSRWCNRAADGIVVVANARWPYRRGPRWLLELGWDFSLFGVNWDRFPEARHVVDEFVTNDDLADVYSSADIVVADQWDHMAHAGFVANRLFDVAASGGFVLSDDGPGVRELFGDAIATFRTREELDHQLRRYLGDPAERDRVARRAMRFVRSEHGFHARARTIIDLLDLRPTADA